MSMVVEDELCCCYLKYNSKLLFNLQDKSDPPPEGRLPAATKGWLVIQIQHFIIIYYVMKKKVCDFCLLSSLQVQTT